MTTDPISAEFGLGLQDIDTQSPNAARIYNFWAGGSMNFGPDREAAARILAQMPRLADAVKANRCYLYRVVRYLLERGVDQFLDLGSGVPGAGNVYEAAQSINAHARVVYVDNDPVATAHATSVLDGDDRATAILADLRDPGSVLDHPQLAATLDLSRPVGVLLHAVLHFVSDEADPAGIIAAYLAPLRPGSYVSISHSDTDPDATVQAAVTADYVQSTGVQFHPRGPQQIAPLLAGLELVEPGIVLVSQWRPDDPPLRTVDIQPMYGAVARKP